MMKKKLTALIIAAVIGACAMSGCSININIDADASTGTQEDMDKEELKWWQEAPAYEIYVKSFKDSDGDGIGDINGVTEKLDHLKSLGVGTIWLTPVYSSPQADNGYDVADYYEIDKMYGTMEDMERLLDEADSRDIRIIMDLVVNHTSEENEWFKESKSSRDNPKSDWYIWSDPAEDGGEPTNWRGIFGGSVWTWCEERGQYYLHTFLKEQPDLNWANPEVRQAVYDVCNFWIDKGVDGFRIDAVTYIKKPEVFENGEPDAEDGMVGVHAMTANTEGILDYLHEFRDNVEKGKDIFTVGEANGVSAAELPKWVGKDGVFDTIFEFSHVNIDLPDEANWCETREWKLTDLKKCMSDSQEATREDGWCTVFFENHDQGRSINHFTPGSKDPVMSGKALGTLLLTLRGTPFIYQGEEIGMTNVDWSSINDYNDISTVNHYNFVKQEGYSEEECMNAVRRFSRDNARTPMQWSDEENAGFTTGTPWLKVADSYKECNVSAEDNDMDSVLAWYRELSEIRQERRELIDGSYQELLKDDEQIFAYIRENNEGRTLVLVNMSDKEATYDASLTEGLFYVASSLGDDEEGRLRPYEAVIYGD